LDFQLNSSNRFVSDEQINSWNAKQSALGFVPENSTNKGASNGYVPLVSGKIPVGFLPPSDANIIVQTISERNAVQATQGIRVHVRDATDDITVGPGWAEYLYVDGAWKKTAQDVSNLFSGKILRGSVAIPNGVDVISVNFPAVFPDTNYSPSLEILNMVDVTPAFFLRTITVKGEAGFAVKLSGKTDSANYVLNWTATRI